MTDNNLEKLARLVRYYILRCTTAAGSGHPTSSLSATDLLVTLMFGGDYFRADLDDPDHVNNDRLIFSKGHASPLFYSLYAAAGKVSEDELLTLRQFGSRLEGHPTMAFPWTEAATGSLGQGLSVGVGMALNRKYLDKVDYRTFVLLGDSEMTEGSVWEAIQLAAHYKLDNLIGFIDVNRLGQRGETMYGHDVSAYEKPIKAFGWKTLVIDGHNFDEIHDALGKACRTRNKPTMIIAKTYKGQGIDMVVDKDAWHGKALKQEEMEAALQAFGDVDTSIRGAVSEPKNRRVKKIKPQKAEAPAYEMGKSVATRKAYGEALNRIFPAYPSIVVLDAEVSNSTHADMVKGEHEDRFFEMFITEQNMVGAAMGLARRGKIPFISTFATFFTRAFDQIRMSQYSDSNIKFCGSHAGVSIGEDGSSQMGLEDIAMFRTLMDSVVLYPSDAVSTSKLVEQMAKHHGNCFIRTTRGGTPVIYNNEENFPIGGSKVVKSTSQDQVTVVGAGITLHEALAAAGELEKEGIAVRVIDLYSIKPIDADTLTRAHNETRGIITVEDHYPEGGIGEAVRSALPDATKPIRSLAVRKMPKSGSTAELMDYEEISRHHIVQAVKDLVG